MFIDYTSFNNKKIKQKIYKTKQKNKNMFYDFIFYIELIKQILEEKIKNKNYEIKNNFIIIEFNFNNDNIVIKYNKRNNNIVVFFNGQNILDRFNNLKNEIIKIFKNYGLTVL